MNKKIITKSAHIDSDTYSNDSIKVLLVEDNEMFAEGLSMLLEMKNIDVTKVYSGDEALKQINEINPDVIVLDIMLTPSMDGFGFIELIKKDLNTAHIPVIMISALNMPDKIEYGLSLGANDYLVKPFKADELSVKIKSIVSLRNNINKFNQNKDILPHISMYDSERSIAAEFAKIVNNAISENVDITIPEINAKLGTGFAKLETLIKKTYNQTPVNYILSKRLEKADLMLHNSNISIKDIAYIVGFKTTSYFCTSYKKKYGKTPMDNRRNQLTNK